MASPCRGDGENGRIEGTCPYMCCIEAAREAEIIVMDYNHVFVESVSDSSLPSMSIDVGSSIVIVDEAHNLPDRIKMGLEMRLTSKTVKAARFELEEHQETLARDGASPEVLEKTSSVFGLDEEGGKRDHRLDEQEEERSGGRRRQ